MEKSKPKPSKKPSPAIKFTLANSISNFLGKDERMLLFRKIKGKAFMFVIKSKSFKKFSLKEKPEAYPIDKFENLGAFLYKLSREKNV